MSQYVRSLTRGGRLALLVASNARANRNPPSCTLVSTGLLLGEFRETPRCHGGANDFSQCAVGSDVGAARATPEAAATDLRTLPEARTSATQPRESRTIVR